MKKIENPTEEILKAIKERQKYCRNDIFYFYQVLYHLIQLIGEKTLNEHINVIISEIKKDKDIPKEEKMDAFLFMFHKGFRQYDICRDIKRTEKITEKPKKDETMLSPEYIKRKVFAKEKIVDDLNGHAEMIMWNLINYNDIFFDILKSIYKEEKNAIN